jgi:hypothetical protein
VVDEWRIPCWMSAVAQTRAGAPLKARLRMIGKGRAPKRVERSTQSDDVIRCATAAREILRVAGLEAHPDLLVLMGAQMVAEIEEERRIIADRLLDLVTPPRVLTTADVVLIAEDVKDAERDDKGAFAWSLDEVAE